jgi:hypothetical protein
MTRNHLSHFVISFRNYSLHSLGVLNHFDHIVFRGETLFALPSANS